MPQVNTVIFQYVRSLLGITATLYDAPTAEDDAPLPFLGKLAMAYLRAHGYGISSILHIASSYQNSASTDDFTASLSQKGLPVAEAKYIWDIINLETPDLNFA